VVVAVATQQMQDSQVVPVVAEQHVILRQVVQQITHQFQDLLVMQMQVLPEILLPPEVAVAVQELRRQIAMVEME
jgi:hypothetical protein